MRSLIIFSFVIAVACAASLGHHNGTKITAPTTTEASVKHVEQKLKALHDDKHQPGNRASASVKLDKINEIEGIHKLEEAIEIEKENSNGAFHVGARTLEAFSKVLNSDDVKEEGKKTTSDHTKKTDAVLETSKTEATKTENGNTTKSSTDEKNGHETSETSDHAGNHVHSRQTDTYFGKGSEIIQNGGLLGTNNGAFGFGNEGIVSSERLISTGGLVNNGGIIRNGNLVNNGGLLRSNNLVYNQGITGNSGLVNTGTLLSSGGQVGAGGLIGSGQVLNARRIYESGQLVNAGDVIGSGVQRANNNILVNNYGSGLVGNNGGIIRNAAEGTNTLVVGLDALDSVPQTVEYSKQFFHFEAPEEHHEEGQITKQLSNVLKKNLQVVFINAPENTASTNAALQLAKQAIEQRTAIYVLSKEAEAAKLVGQLQQIQENVQTAPEIRIIKYRTPEDLERAKLDIQAQYEATGGSSESFNGGVAPLLNYASPGQNIRDIGTLLTPGLITSTNAGGGNYGQSSNVVSAVADSEQINGGQNVALGKQALLGSSVGQLNIIRSSNIGSSNLLGSGSSNVYNSNIGSSSQLGSGSLVGLNSGSSKFFTAGPLVGSSIGSTGSVGSALLQGAKTLTQSPITSGNLLISNSGSSNLLGTGTLVGPNIGSSGNGLLLAPTTRTPSFVGGNSQVRYSNSESLKPVGINTGYTRGVGSNSIVAPISGQSFQVESGSSLSGGSPLLESYQLSNNEGFGSSSLQATSNKLASGSNLGLSSGSQTNVVGSQLGSSNGPLKVVSLVTGSPAASSTVAGSSLGSSNIQSGGSLSGFNSGSSRVVGGGSSNFGTSSLLGSNQGSLQRTGGNFASGSGSAVGSTTISPKLYTTSTPLGASSLLGSSQGALQSTGGNFASGGGSAVGSTTISPITYSTSTPLGASSLLGSSQGALQSTGGNLASGSGSVVGSTTISPKTYSTSTPFGASSLSGSSHGPIQSKGGNFAFGSGSVVGSTTIRPKSSTTSTPSGASSILGSNQDPLQSTGGNFASGSGSVVGSTTIRPKSSTTSTPSGASSFFGSNQGPLQSTGGNFASGSGSVVGSTTTSPKSFTTSTPLGVAVANTGSSKFIGNGLLLESSPGSNARGATSSFGSGVKLSNIGESGSLVKSKAGSYASDLTVGSSKQSGSGFPSGTGSVKQYQTGKLASETGSALSFGSASSKTNDNVSVLSSTGIDHGQSGSSFSSNQTPSASGSGILLGSSVGSGGKYVSGLGVGSKIGEIVKVNN